MSLPVSIATVAVSSEPPTSKAPRADTSAQRIPRDVARHVVTGTSVLALGVMIERGSGLIANILAARLGGMAVFGAYSLAVSTANNISTYAAGGIGATATRFSGKYPYESSGYGTLARVLGVVACCSAFIAAAILWVGAFPIAVLLHNANLFKLLKWASLSAVGIILLECARGFFVGQRRLAALVLLSLLVGAGMLCLLPLMASMRSPTRMVIAQGCVSSLAIIICLLFVRPLGLLRISKSNSGLPFPAMLKEVWAFGIVQLAGLVASNLAGWWLIALVAREDTTLVQMSFFAVASQLRNLAGLGPSLLTEGSYASLASQDAEHSRTPHHLMAVCTFVSTFVVLMLACAGMVFAPLGLHLLYGQGFTAAAVTVALGLAVSVVHMGNAPAAARLSIVSIRMTGVINTVWAITIAATGTVLFLHRGSAAQAMAIYFGAHALSAILVLMTLWKKDHVPPGMPFLFLLSTFIALALALLAVLRQRVPSYFVPITLTMGVLSALGLVALLQLARRRDWLPSKKQMEVFCSKLAAAATGRFGMGGLRVNG